MVFATVLSSTPRARPISLLPIPSSCRCWTRSAISWYGDSRLSHVDELLLDWIVSAEFDRLLVDTVRSTYPTHEHERFIGHFRGLIGQWVRERGATASLSQ
jgi:hypothetical protein